MTALLMILFALLAVSALVWAWRAQPGPDDIERADAIRRHPSQWPGRR